MLLCCLSIYKGTNSTEELYLSHGRPPGVSAQKQVSTIRQNVLRSKLRLRHKPRPCQETATVGFGCSISWLVNSPRQTGAGSHAARTTSEKPATHTWSQTKGGTNLQPCPELYQKGLFPLSISQLTRSRYFYVSKMVFADTLLSQNRTHRANFEPLAPGSQARPMPAAREDHCMCQTQLKHVSPRSD